MSHLSNSATNMTFSNLNKQNTKKLCFQDIIKDKYTSSLSQPLQFECIEDVHRRVQTTIKKHIEIYNAKMNEIIETLNHMHIKDIMFFNELLNTNDCALQKNSITELVEIPKEHTVRVFEIEKAILKVICSPLKSFQTRTTFDSKNRRTFSQNSSTTIANGKSFKGSDKSQNILSSKNNKMKQDSLQDTPESVKSKLSCVNRIKVEKPAMFDRIDICQSLQEMMVQQEFPLKQKINRYDIQYDE